jgi:hypothetical protein
MPAAVFLWVFLRTEDYKTHPRYANELKAKNNATISASDLDKQQTVLNNVLIRYWEYTVCDEVI